MIKLNLISNYLGQGLVAIVNVAFIPIYLRYLGVEAYGVMGLFAVLQAWLGLLDMGMTPALSREMALFTGGQCTNEFIRDLLRSVEIIMVGIGLFIIALISKISGFVAAYWVKSDNLSNETISNAITMMGIVTALRFVEGAYRSAILGMQRQILFNLVNSGLTMFRAFGAVGIMIWISPTLETFFYWQAIVSIVTLVILGLITYSCIPTGARGGRFSKQSLRRVWRFASGMMGITFLSLILMQVDKIILSKLLTLSQFGWYTLAYTVANSIFQLIGPITQAFYPKFCELYGLKDTATIVINYHNGAQLVSVIAGSAAAVLIVFGQEFLQLWTQDSMLANQVSSLLSVLVFGNMLNGLMWIPYWTQLAHGWTSLSVKVNLVAVVLIVPGIFVGVHYYGVVGAAWVWVALNAGYYLIGIQFMYFKILHNEKWRWYIYDTFLPLSAAGLGVGFIKIILPSPRSSVSQFIMLLTALLFSIICSFLAASSLRVIVIHYIKSVLDKNCRNKLNKN